MMGPSPLGTRFLQLISQDWPPWLEAVSLIVTGRMRGIFWYAVASP